MPARADVLRKMIAARPDDPFPRYGLAMELRNTGQRDDAHAEFAALEEKFADYVPAYLMHGQLLVEMGRGEDAKGVLTRGIAVAQKKADGKALGEMQTLLDSLG